MILVQFIYPKYLIKSFTRKFTYFSLQYYHKPLPLPRTLLRSQMLNTKTTIDFVPLRTDISCATKNYDDMFHLKFGCSGKYLVVLRESTKKARKGNMLYGKLWWMQIFRDENFYSSSGPNYMCVGLSTFFSVPEIRYLPFAEPWSGFPPKPSSTCVPTSLGQISANIYLDFDTPLSQNRGLTFNQNTFPAHDPPVVDPYFSDDGIYLCGTDAPLELVSRAKLKISARQ